LTLQYKNVINKFENISNVSLQSEIGKSLTADFGMFTHFFGTIVNKDTFLCPKLLHLLYCFAWEIFVALKLNDAKESHKQKQSDKEVIKEDLLVDTNNTNPNIATDMEIEVVKKNQSTDMLTNTNTDEDFELVMSKSKRK
jgi:hypothetical protein